MTDIPLINIVTAATQSPKQVKENDALKASRAFSLLKASGEYEYEAAKVLGIAQILLGILIGACETVVYCYVALWGTAGYAGSFGLIAPVLFILAGLFAIQSSRINSSCGATSLTLTMVLSIIGAVLCVGVIVEGVIYCVSEEVIFERHGYKDNAMRYHRTLQVLYGAMAFFGVVEAIVAIITSALCCQATCCKPSQRVVPFKDEIEHATDVPQLTSDVPLLCA